MIRGGKGDKAKPSDFDPEQLRMGIEVEMEHTKNRRLAREIAMDHLSEDPRYYTKLKKVHKESAMHSFEELLQLVQEVHDRLSEASPPPFRAAERQAAGMKPLASPKLKSRTGATPPPIPKNEPSADTKAELGNIRKMNTNMPLRGKPAPAAKKPDVHSKFDLTTTEGFGFVVSEIRSLLGG